jgi:hypothetical protein
MKKLVIILAVFSLSLVLKAQDNVYPAKENKGLIFITNATVHVGNGQVIENATVKINNSKIELVGQNIPVPSGDAKVFDVKGKHVYPGLILSNSQIGLVEISSISVQLLLITRIRRLSIRLDQMEFCWRIFVQMDRSCLAPRLWFSLTHGTMKMQLTSWIMVFT